METLEEQFKEALYEICDEARKINYRPAPFEQMLHDWGAVATAQRLLGSDPPQYGLNRLWDLQRLDISLECVVLKPEFQPLFTEKQLDVARRRLRDRGFDPTLCEGS